MGKLRGTSIKRDLGGFLSSYDLEVSLKACTPWVGRCHSVNSPKLWRIFLRIPSAIFGKSEK